MLAQEIINFYMREAGDGDFEVIKLKNAQATDAARMLDEAFNGPRQQTQQPGGGGPAAFFAQFAGRGAAPPANPSANRIRVVADPSTNKLLIRATPLDMLAIRRLIAKGIDPDDAEEGRVIRTHIIGPLKYASAVEVAGVLREVYREQMNNNPAGRGAVAASFVAARLGGGPQNLNVDANGNPRAVTLSVGVDDRTNSLVLACSQAMYEDVKKLIDMLEEKAKDTTRTVEVIQLIDVDPELVQQAIEALQGRRPRTTGQATAPMGSVPGAGGVVPGGGGFQPPGGGGGGRQPGGGGRGQRPGAQRGPDFFGEAVKDDPKSSLLYDPNPLTQAVGASFQLALDHGQVGNLPPQNNGYNEEQEQQPPVNPPGGQQPPARPQEPILGPRGNVNAEALSQLGIMVISGNKADVVEVLKIIEIIKSVAAGGEIVVRLVPLERADSTYVANTLTLLFQRFLITPSSISALPAAGRPGAPTAPTVTPGGTQAQNIQQSGSVTLIPLPRLNAILMTAPRARVDWVISQIKSLDIFNRNEGGLMPFKLEHASAARVAAIVTNFYAQRYTPQTTAQQQIRVTYDDHTNTVFVQAAPADLDEIRALIMHIDKNDPPPENVVRIVNLRTAIADDLANLLILSIAQGIMPPTAGTTTGLPGGAGLPGGLGGGAGLGQIPGAGGAGRTTAPAGGTTLTTKTPSLKFIGKDGGTVKSGLLEDIHITSDPRTNSLIISAPQKSMELVLALIRELDVPPTARAEIKVFPLKKADATQMATMLQQLFLGTGGVGTTGAARPGGMPGTTGGFTGGGTGAFPGTSGIGGTGQARPLSLSVGGETPPGAPIIDLRITIDQRTNSVIVAGSVNDLLVIEAIVSRIESSPVPERRNEVFHLKNSAAVDVANAVSTFLTSTLQVQTLAGVLTAYQELEQQVVIVPEPISNKLLISATPLRYAQIVHMIKSLDEEPPQVMIAVLIAEVDLTGTEEVGVELGLQTPVLFQRGIIPFGSGWV